MRHRTVVREFLDEAGHSPFGRWFDNLGAVAASKVSTGLYRMEQSNFSNAEGVGEGVSEYKIDFGPGYGIYFGRNGEALATEASVGETKPRHPPAGSSPKALLRLTARPRGNGC